MYKVIVLHTGRAQRTTISVWQISRQGVPKRLDYNNPTRSSLLRVLTYIRLKQEAKPKAGRSRT